MPVAKRRKVTTTLPKSNPSSLRAITAFTKVSKSQVTSKSIYDKVDCSAPTQLAKSFEADRKRKLQVVEIEVDAAAVEASAILRTAIGHSQRDIKPLPQRRSTDSQKIPETPRKSVLSSSANSNPAKTPTKGARALLDNLILSSSSGKFQTSPLRSQESAVEETYSSSYESVIEVRPIVDEDGKLPTELLDILNLHSSFLTALSLYHAHNGTQTPADLRVLCPDVSRAWGKRKVMLEDIRRILGVLNNDITEDKSQYNRPLAHLSLSDYGHGKICVETKNGIGKDRKASAPLDENRLNNAFGRNLQKLWNDRERDEEAIVSIFIGNLPLEPITTCSSLTKISPLLAKGQRRLEDLKAGILLKKQVEKEQAITVSITDEKGRKLTLLERLKAKELRQSTLPAPPSKAELGRRAALHRLEEVVSVLSLLTTSTSIGQQRVSFTMPTVLGKLKDSFKTPISREEGETCVRLLASDIAPEWLRVVKMGKTNAVVVNRDNRPSDLDIKERVKRAVG
jgi:hypothetical protein